MEVVLDKTLLEPVQERVKQGGFGDVAEYVRALIEADLLEQKLLEGVRSGPPVEADDNYWEAMSRDA